MSENILNARIQHAVIGEGSTTTSVVPKKGEVVFNAELTNCKVGDGTTTYMNLPYFISKQGVWYITPTTSMTLQNCLTEMLYNSNEEEIFDINKYNHIIIADTGATNYISESWISGNVNLYSITSYPPSDNTHLSILTYLRNHYYKSLRLTFVSSNLSSDKIFGWFQNTGNSIDTTWINQLIVSPDYSLWSGHPSTSTTNYILGAYKNMEVTINSYQYQTIQITCVDPTNNIFLIE